MYNEMPSLTRKLAKECLRSWSRTSLKPHLLRILLQGKCREELGFPVMGDGKMYRFPSTLGVRRSTSMADEFSRISLARPDLERGTNSVPWSQLIYSHLA